MVKAASDNEAKHESLEASDPVLAMLGVGSYLWKHEPGDKFVERLRAEDLTPPPFEIPKDSPAGNSLELVWRRICEHQGEEFKTATQLPFTYIVEGAGIWFFRNGRRVNRKLSRSQVEIAITRCPLISTTEIRDLIDYPYLFGVLMDARIRHGAW